MKSKKTKILLGIGVGILGIIVGVFSYQIGKSVGEGVLSVEATEDTLSNSILQLKEWEYDLDNFKKQYIPNEVHLTASDGQEVVGYYYTVDDKLERDTVILVHGMGGEAICMAPWIEMYLNQDINVFAIDRRGTGKVKGGQLTYGYKESKDLTVCVDYLKARMGNHHLILHGQSLGGTVVGVYSATKHAEEHIDAVILEAPMESLEYMFLMAWREMDGYDQSIPEDYLVACGSLYLKIKEGFTFADINLLMAQKKNKKPTLVIGGTKDELCTPQISKEIYNQVASKNKMYEVMDTDHIEGYIDMPKAYTKIIKQFISTLE